MPISQKIEQVEKDIMGLKNRMENLESQMGRLVSHVESEVAAARGDILRIDAKLFGKDEDDVYGGRIGQLTKMQYAQDRQMVWAAGFIAAIFALFEIYKALH